MKDIPMWRGFITGNVYPVSQLDKALTEAIETDPVEIIKSSTSEYFNIPAAFDIETTSYTIPIPNGKEDEVEKKALMYVWQFGINGTVIYGRTWEEWVNMLHQLVDYLDLSDHRKLIIYVHNLGYEFQFMRKWIKWDKIFAIKKRRPVYAISGGLEFRCSLFLSNYSLDYIGENLLHRYPVKKLVGNLDYSLMRHSQTPLTSDELAYCINDVKVVMAYIQEKIEQDGDITKIPLTNTGYVRNYCRAECFTGNAISEEEKRKISLNYHSLMKSLQIRSADEYDQLKRAFMGGFTHASALWSNRSITTYNASFAGDVMVDSIEGSDIISSYPGEMLRSKFPMTQFELVGDIQSDKIFKHLLKNYCCVFDVEFTNLFPKVEYENPLSLSHCHTEGQVCVNNGRIVAADKCMTTLTELDWDTITKFYEWDSIKVLNMRISHKGYLPKDLILAILKLYADKTSLKGVEGKEIEYLVSKNMINAAFGMMVTAIVRGEFNYNINNDQWSIMEADVENQLTKYNRNFNRFLYYAWGVWVTAHARHSLFEAIHEFGEDYIYADTDSIKGVNFKNHADFFFEKNNRVIRELLAMCNHYGIPFSKCCPKTPKGVAKIPGTWEHDSVYLAFKTCGAKRYIYELPNHELSLTVSGLNKKFAIPYLIQEYDNDYELIFDAFGEGFYVPAGHTGKMTLSYLDEASAGVLVDYLGKRAIWHERSSIHMESQSFKMSMLDDYIKFLEGIQYVEL